MPGTGIDYKARQWIAGIRLKVTADVTAFPVRLFSEYSDCRNYTKHQEHTYAGLQRSADYLDVQAKRADVIQIHKKAG